MTNRMSTFDPKRTCRETQSMSLLGVKRTCRVALHMSAFDPKRTSCRGAKHRNLLRMDLAVNRPGADMQRRGGSGQQVKGPRTSKPKVSKTPTSRVSDANLQEQVAALTRELKEAREQLSATGDVLKIISSSPGDLAPVFQAMLENACRICAAKFGNLLIYDGNGFQVPAMYGAPREYAQLRQKVPIIQPGPKNPLRRVIKTKQLQHIADITKEAAFIEREPAFVQLAETAGARTVLLVPMLKETQLIGVIAIYRQEARPFTDKQIELVKNFAAQAVIAIENARLVNELRQRTGDLWDALEQQTATSEVLEIVASSPGNLEPVFNKMLGSATRICEAKFGTLFLYDGNTFRVAAGVGTPPELAEFERLRGPFRPELGSRLERIVGTKQVIHKIGRAHV